MTAALQRMMPLVIVETARDLPATDKGWTTQPFLRFTGGDEGAGQVIGSITIEQHFGDILPEYRASFERIGVVPDVGGSGEGTLAGQVVRLLVQDAAGTITRGSGIYRATYVEAWHGQIIGPTVAGDGGHGGVATWQAVGLPSFLEQIPAGRRGWVRTSDGSGVVDPGFCPPFNAIAGGDCSSGTYTVNGETVRVHDLTTVASGTQWTARDILDLVLAGATRIALDPTATTVRGWRWTIADPDNCLAFIPETIDPASLTVGQLVNLLISTRRGLIWWPTVSGATVTINVRSGVRDAIPGTGYTLPASSSTTTLDPSDSPWWIDPAIGEDTSSTYDILELRGARPWVALTLLFDGTSGAALVKGWSPASETTWNTSGRGNLTRDVWRRLELNTAWNGAQYLSPSTGLRQTLATATSAEQGAGGYTGARSFATDTAATRVPAWLARLESALPCSVGFSTLRVGPRQRPVVVVGSGSMWEDKSGWSVDVQQHPPAIILDDGVGGEDIAAEIAAGRQILITIGVREIQPLRVSWQREPSEIPRALPRVKVIDQPQCEQWMVLAGTVTGVSTDGTTLTTRATDLTIRDDLPTLRRSLPLVLAGFGENASRCSFAQAGLDISAARRPGVLLTDANRGDRTVAVDQVITRRRWSVVVVDGVDQYRTNYECAYVFPEMESVL